MEMLLGEMACVEKYTISGYLKNGNNLAAGDVLSYHRQLQEVAEYM